MSRIIAEIIVNGARVVGRAVGKVIADEIAASQRAAQARRSSSGPPPEHDDNSTDSDSDLGISLPEAKLILNIKDITDSELLKKQYEHLFRVNDKKAGGSLYLQSKVFRAKERIDYENSTGKTSNEEGIKE